jgi:hypothetical protein
MTTDSEQVETEKDQISNILPSPALSMPVGGTPVSINDGARIKLRKLTPEEKAILWQETGEVGKMRGTMLTSKLIERLRPYVEAKHSGEKDDPEMMAFVTNMRREAEKLRTEHFGVEVSQSFVELRQDLRGLYSCCTGLVRHTQ